MKTISIKIVKPEKMKYEELERLLKLYRGFYFRACDALSLPPDADFDAVINKIKSKFN